MKRSTLRRRAELRGRKPLRRTEPLQRTPSLTATDSQRAAVAGRPCIVCGATLGVDPAHLLSVRMPCAASVCPGRSLVEMSARRLCMVRAGRASASAGRAVRAGSSPERGRLRRGAETAAFGAGVLARRRAVGY